MSIRHYSGTPRKSRWLLILLYVESHAGCIASRIVEDIYPDATRGESSKRRHAFLEVRQVEEKGLIQRVGARFYPRDAVPF